MSEPTASGIQPTAPDVQHATSNSEQSAPPSQAVITNNLPTMLSDLLITSKK